ncbi:hypothetical protein LB507_008634 [Fusarium sp. FIESC RH6]|nr:hypothetical protein LB507_008634 [Fusarium sp. FIESC RH6]
MPLTAVEHFNKTAEKYEAATGGATRELAQHAISSIADLKPLTSDSKILDNVCGTGIVTDIILNSGIQPEIHAVDVAENMINIAKGKGAREIARTLRPDGVAVVTGWTMMGHIKIIQEVQEQIRPGDTPFKPPMPEIWLDPEHTKAVLSDAGLDVQSTTTVDVYLGNETTEGVADVLIHGFGAKVSGSWTEEEQEKGAAVMKKIVWERAVPFTRPSGSGVGIKVTGAIFIARKKSGL